ncbi:MAG: hypothetical protein KDK23_08555 [Leptospiraceae bacterium]|nr:hypothetical protein [Leptospiraceae bacterium]
MIQNQKKNSRTEIATGSLQRIARCKPDRCASPRRCARAFALLSFRLLLPAAILAGFSGCKTVEEYLSTINVAAGLDSSSVTFYTRKSETEQLYSNDPSDERFRRNHSDFVTVERPFYSISSAPRSLPFLGDEGWFRYMRTSITLNSPRTYRGTLINYPDDGRTSADAGNVLFYELFPLPDRLGRRMDFIYEEYRAYFTLYFPYFSGENWYLAFGQSYGQSRYNFDLLEREYRLASVVGQWTPVYMVSMTYGYRVGRFFERGFWSNTYLFLEVSSDAKTIQPVAVSIPRSSGLPSDRLYANMTYARIGIRKTISFSDAASASEPQDRRSRFTEEEEKTLPEPNPDLSKTRQKKPEHEDRKKDESLPEEKPPSRDRPQRDPPDDSYFPY